MHALALAVDGLKAEIEARGLNTESLGDLLRGFFRFYSEEWDPDCVVNIRTGDMGVTKALLARRASGGRGSFFSGRSLAIEDPFDECVGTIGRKGRREGACLGYGSRCPKGLWGVRVIVMDRGA